MGVVIVLLAAYYCTSNAIQLLLVFLSRRALSEKRSVEREYEEFLEQYQTSPKVSVLVPAFNEALVIAESVRSFARMYYPNLEILVIDDGSTDETRSILTREFNLVFAPVARKNLISRAEIIATATSQTDPRVRLIIQENAGKASALNTGIDFAQGALVVTLDADTVAEEDALVRLIPLFAQDPRLIGASGVVRILNGNHLRRSQVRSTGRLPNHPLALFQIIEYMRAFYIGRIGWDRIGATLLLSGAFTVFRKDVLIAVGGFERQSITEDFEIVVRIRKWLARSGHAGRFVLIPDPICWTQSPQTMRDLRRQRLRWQSGLLATSWHHRGFFFSRRSGVAGWLAMPYLVIIEALSPVFEILAFAVLGYHQWSHPHGGRHLREIVIIAVVGVALSWFFNVLAIHWSETRFRRHKEPTRRSPGQRALNLARFVGASILEMVLFHPLVSWWKLEALLRYPFVKRVWGKQTRAAVPRDQDRNAA